MKRPPVPGSCVRCHQPPVLVIGKDGLPVPPLVDGLCFFCRMVPNLTKREDLQGVR